MTTDRTTETIVETWLVDGFTTQPDTAAMLRTIRAAVADTPQRHHRWWPFGRPIGTPVPTSGHASTRGFTMFSSLKSIAAAVIVALFGGFLLTGILTTPDDDQMAPAAVTASPSPMSTQELLSGMLTEEVEPGVFRVINDGVRDLSYPDEGFPGYFVNVTPDGSVWLSGEGGRKGLFRLGDEATFEDPTYNPPFKQVAPDGSLWAIGEGGSIRSFDGETWTERIRGDGLAIGPDGTVWVTASTRDERCLDSPADCPFTVLMRLDEDGSLTTIDDWADIYEGRVARRTSGVSRW